MAVVVVGEDGCLNRRVVRSVCCRSNLARFWGEVMARRRLAWNSGKFPMYLGEQVARTTLFLLLSRLCRHEQIDVASC